MNPRKPPRRHACVRCVHSKVRCSTLEGGTACERCARLGRECIFSDTSRSSRPKHDSKDRIDRLQEQVDSLAAQLAQKDIESAQTPLQPRNGSESQTPDALPKESIPASESRCDLFARGIITTTEAGRLLEKFRVNKMPQFPFVIVPREMSVSALREQYPFLLMTIMTASLEDNLQLQGELASEVKRAIGTRVILNNERNLDILLGLLVHVAWYHYHWQTMHTQMYLLLQMAIMIVVDLGLDKDENFGLYTGIQKSEKTPEEKHQSPTGKRALLACYYLCSVSSIFRKQLFMRHTEWIAQCCNTLLEKPEYPTDTLLKNYIDIQVLSRKSEEMLYPNDHDWDHRTTGPSRNLLLELLQEQGTQIQASVSQCKMQDQWTLFLELKAIPTYILGHEIRHRNNIFSPNHTSQLQALLSSTHASVSSLLELPLDTIVHLPACSLTTLWYCLLILSKLTLLAPTDVWNEKIGLEKKCVYQLGLDTMKKFGALSTGDDVWANSRRVIGSMLSWLEKHEMSNLQPSNIEPHRATPNSHGLSHPTCTSNNIYTSDNIYSADASVPASWYGKSAGFQNSTNANAVPSLQSNQTEYIENPTQEFWNDAIWQQMLEDFAVMPTALPAQFSSPPLGPSI